MGVLCLSVLFSWGRRGGVAPGAGPISSPSFGRVKWKEMSAGDGEMLKPHTQVQDYECNCFVLITDNLQIQITIRAALIS